MTSEHMEILVEQARAGDEAALTDLIRRVQDPIYGLSIRMLGDPNDAEDATQEILVKLVTHLSGFRGESAFTSWAYRVAANHLLNLRRAGRRAPTFEQTEAHLERELAAAQEVPAPTPEDTLLVAEIRLGCLHGLLLALDRDLRLAFILGEILELGGQQAAWILDITPAAYRKRLSRARQRLGRFLTRNCGLVNGDNRCHCARWLPHAKSRSQGEGRGMRFASRARSGGTDAPPPLPEGLDELARVAHLFRSQPGYVAPEGLLSELKSLLC